MPKSLLISPHEVRQSGQVDLEPIPVNRYDGGLVEELKHYGAAALVRIQRDMMVIRQFETMLLEVSLRGNFKGVAYSHKGPAHLSIGHEGACVGQAFLLGIDDLILGTHRSHGDILAKGLSAIESLPEDALLGIMENYMGGRTLRVVEKRGQHNVKELAIEFLIYGAMAEIFHRQTGLNCGMGGSMHAFFPPFGIYPNNAIVGASADIAVGAALFKRINQKPGIVICNIGDGAAGCGPVWEGLCFATMDQFKLLWEETHRGGLPFIMNFVNNFYAMGGQPVGETTGFRQHARIGAGLCPEQMHAERVDGFNPLAVIDALRRKKEIIARGEGPVLLETLVYRFSGHSPSDASSYRERAEIESWQQFDPLRTYAENLIEVGLTTRGNLETEAHRLEELVLGLYKLAIDETISPREDIVSLHCQRETKMFSNERQLNLDPTRKPETLLPHAENPRVQQLATRSRSAFDAHGERVPKTRCYNMRDALFEAILHHFETDATLVAYGEENRDWGGAFAVYRGLTEALPYHRLFNAPIAEAAIVGTAIGYALHGGRALVELMYCDFLGRCGDEVFNQLAKWQAMSGGLLRMPVVIRLMVGSMYGAQHSQDWTAMCAHIPGLKVVFPATPYDAKGMMHAALAGTDPVLFFESQRLYDVAEEFVAGGVPIEPYEVPLGEPAIRRTGKDLTILTLGSTLYRALEAADRLRDEFDMTAEVIDARSVVPINFEPIVASLRKTRRIILASDGVERGNIMHTWATHLASAAFDDLDAPPVVLGARNWIAPAYEVENRYYPFPEDFIDAVHQHFQPLRNYQPVCRTEAPEIFRRYAQGV